MPRAYFFTICGTFLMFLSLVSCKDKTLFLYEEACGVGPTSETKPVPTKTYDFNGNLVDTIFPGNIYVPNIFVPGVDDNAYFVVFGGQGVKRIVFFNCVDNKNEPLYTAENFQVNDLGKGWDGHTPDGSIFYGVFKYSLGVEYLDGSTQEFAGAACSFNCGGEGFPKKKLPDCFFPSQHNGYGSPDHTLYTPTNCF